MHNRASRRDGRFKNSASISRFDRDLVSSNSSLSFLKRIGKTTYGSSFCVPSASSTMTTPRLGR
jgi:hypothetical protein